MALLLIFLLYAIVGLLAACGAIAITSRHLAPRLEQAAYGILLSPIALIYLAFLARLSPEASWHAELLPAVGFAVLGLAGARYMPLLLLSYVGHGAWDLIHEVRMFQGRLEDLTAIPLAYGVFCAVFDWVVAGYFWIRRGAWAAAWRDHQPGPGVSPHPIPR